MPKKLALPSIKSNQPVRLTDDAARAVEEYQSYMLHQHNQLVSINKSINALVLNGMQYIRDAREAQTQEPKP